MTRIHAKRWVLIVPAMLTLAAAGVLGWDAFANEGLSARSVALAACVAAAGATFLLLGLRK